MGDQEFLAGKRPALQLRCAVLQTIRSFFLEQGFLEVQTPVRTPAPAPELHIDAVPADGWFLNTSPELYMKRLLAAGYEKIFQIAPVFRQGEQGRLHHPEFTLLEWYRLHSDYRALQQDCRNLLAAVCAAADTAGGGLHTRGGLTVEGPWQCYTVREAFRQFAGWDPHENPDADRFDLDLVEKIEPQLGFPQPAFLTDYPSYQAALARLKADQPAVAERFELYWGALELANGFSELTDPAEQRQRFEETLQQRTEAGLSAYPLPEEFLHCLNHLPPCAGIALGVDRLVMLLAGADRLDDVVAFPPPRA